MLRCLLVRTLFRLFWRMPVMTAFWWVVAGRRLWVVVVRWCGWCRGGRWRVWWGRRGRWRGWLGGGRGWMWVMGGGGWGRGGGGWGGGGVLGVGGGGGGGGGGWGGAG